MGATVQVAPESAAVARAQEHLTNTQGIFRDERLAPGLYTVRVTLAGFLPTLEQHVRITANLTTLVRIELESMFASLDRLRRQPASNADAEDWKWVLRSAAAMRPVLLWNESAQISATSLSTADSNSSGRPHARLELTSGSRRPGSVSNLADAAGTAFAYDQRIGAVGRLLLAGQMSYERAPAGGIATIWVPSGSLDAGPRTTMVLRQAKLGFDGPTFRGVRLDQSGTLGLGGNVIVRYGAEYVLVGLGRSASALRPRMEVDVRINEDWHAAVIFAAQPGAPALTDSGEGDNGGALVAALNQLDAFPALLWRDGHPVLEGGWHEEVSARRRLGTRGGVEVAAFHDDNRHVAVFGRATNAVGDDFLRDFFSNGFVTDGGSSSSWGTRVALREKLSENVELTTVYTFAGALAPGEVSAEDLRLRDGLRTRQRHAAYAGVKARVPRLGTRVSAGYEWINGSIVSRMDGYGESIYQNGPYLHVSVRQHLPKFAPGHWEALAECQNLLAQGFVPVSGRDGNLVLVPAFRTFRGGVNVQF